MKISKILVSQPTPAIAEKSPYYEIHTRFGVKVDYRPLIRVEGVTLKEFRAQRVEILAHSAVIFTSRATIDHFFRICEEARVTVPETMKYICNTEATALYLQKYIIYRKRKIFFANGSFSGFMELIMKHKNERYLLILSEPYSPEIPDTLAKLRIRFNKVVLSHTVSAELKELNIKAYDMVAVFSPAEISALTAEFGTTGLPLIATFGDGTTRAAIDAGLTVNVKAPTPEAPSMARAIELFIKKISSGAEVAPVSVADSPSQADEFIKIHEPKMSRRPAAKKAIPGAASAKPATVKPVATKAVVVKKEAAAPVAAVKKTIK